MVNRIAIRDVSADLPRVVDCGRDCSLVLRAARTGRIKTYIRSVGIAQEAMVDVCCIGIVPNNLARVVNSCRFGSRRSKRLNHNDAAIRVAQESSDISREANRSHDLTGPIDAGNKQIEAARVAEFGDHARGATYKPLR